MLCGDPSQQVKIGDASFDGLLHANLPFVTQTHVKINVVVFTSRRSLVVVVQVKVEDAGFDWKILGPDVQEEEYVAHTCDQDAYAYRCFLAGLRCRPWSLSNPSRRRQYPPDKQTKTINNMMFPMVFVGPADPHASVGAFPCACFVVSSGQKCSAQSILFVHENWSKSGILETLKSLASQRTLEDLTVRPGPPS